MEQFSKVENLKNELRVEAVDTSHPAWASVLRSVFRTGDGQSLMLHDDGRLSSRQTVLAAFADDDVVGHLCFSIDAKRSAIGRATVSTKLDSFAVDPTFAGAPVEQLLSEAADKVARQMSCRAPRLEAAAMC